MSTITAILEPASDGTLHVPVPKELRHTKFKVVATPQEPGDSTADAASETERQRKLRTLLEEISKSNPFQGVDPVAWQREMRDDRDLMVNSKCSGRDNDVNGVLGR